MGFANPHLHVLLNAHKQGHNNTLTERSSDAAIPEINSNNTDTTQHDATGVVSSNIFLTLFILGFIGVVFFYTFKKLGTKCPRLPRTYKYSSLNQYEGANDDEALDFGEVDDVFVNESTDEEDVAFDRRLLGDEEEDAVFLGQHINSLSTSSFSSDTVVFNSVAANPMMVAVPTQLGGNGKAPVHPSSLLEDSDEELLQ